MTESKQPAMLRVTDPLQSILQHQSCIILDGAMGTELERRGVDITAGTQLWSSQLLIDNPAVLRDIHKDYLAAGADVITTATYQANIPGFASAGVSEEEAGQYIKLGVQLAAEARDAWWQQQQQQDGADASSAAKAVRQRPLVGFSAGSYGASLCDGSEFTGDYADRMTESQLAEWHLQRLLPVVEDAQARSQFDLVCFETVPCLKEVRAICTLLSTHHLLANVHAWISCSCKDELHTCHGERFAEQVIPCIWACEQVVAVGVNCTAPAYIPTLLRDARNQLEQLSETSTSPASQLPLLSRTRSGTARQTAPPILLCYPNSGEEWDKQGRCWKSDSTGCSSPSSFAAAARSWVQAGACAVGGCCRTCPNHITELRATLLEPAWVVHAGAVDSSDIMPTVPEHA